MQKLRIVFRVMLVFAGVLSLTLGGITPAFSGAGSGSSQEIAAGINAPDNGKTTPPKQSDKRLLSDEELQEMTEIASQSTGLGNMSGGHGDYDGHLHVEDVLIIVLGLLCVLIILAIIF